MFSTDETVYFHLDLNIIEYYQIWFVILFFFVHSYSCQSVVQQFVTAEEQPATTLRCDHMIWLSRFISYQRKNYNKICKLLLQYETQTWTTKRSKQCLMCVSVCSFFSMNEMSASFSHSRLVLRSTSELYQLHFSICADLRQFIEYMFFISYFVFCFYTLLVSGHWTI